jgi:hypothetical protein
VPYATDHGYIVPLTVSGVGKNFFIWIQRALAAARPKRADPEGTTTYNLPLNTTPHHRGNAGP